MSDTTVRTGTSGTLIIRDHGYRVEFLISNTQGATWVNGGTWGGHIGGSQVGGSFSIRGAQTVSLGSWDVGSNADVGFTMNRTGTQGLGGPTSISRYIQRSTLPPPPRAISLDEITQTSMRMRFESTGDGGAPVLEWQIGYSDVSGSTKWYLSSNGTSTIGGLQPAKQYYFWARGRNQHGWSGWSNRLSARTIAGARVRYNGAWREAIPYVRVNGTWRLARPYARRAGSWRIGL